MTRKGTDGGELLKIPPDARQPFIQDYAEFAQLAYDLGGRRALELPAARTSAAHEAGHAVMYATADKPPYMASIWRVPVANGYAGECSFGPDAPPFRLDTRTDPRRGLEYAAILLAGPLSELLLTTDDYRYGSSIDEWMVAGTMIAGACQELGCSPERIHTRLLDVVCQRLTEERQTLERVQRLLMREGRIRGPKLRALLSPVRRLDLAAVILQVGHHQPQPREVQS